jgi:hypothetical protein
MIHGEATLAHHLFQITIRELKTAIPANAQENDRWLIVPPLKKG